MATSKLAILIETLYKGKGAKAAEKDIRSLDDAAGMVKDTLGDLALVGGVVAGAFVAMGYAAKQGLDFLEEGGKINQMSQAFDGLAISIGETSDTLMGAMRNATYGMIDDMTLMNTANRFVSMGLAETGAEAAKLAEIAVTLGAAMGKDAGAAMEEFGLLLANTSTLRLDTFGISAGKVKARIKELADEFPEMSRETAFMTATMEQAEISMGRVGDMAVNSASVIKAEFTNNINQLKSDMAEGLMPVLADMAENLLPQIGQAFVDITPKAIEFGKSIIDTVTLATTTYEWNLLRNALIDVGASWADVDDIVKDGRATMRLFRNELEMQADLEANRRGIERMTFALELQNKGLEVGTLSFKRWLLAMETATARSRGLNVQGERWLEWMAEAEDDTTELTYDIYQIADATDYWMRSIADIGEAFAGYGRIVSDVTTESGRNTRRLWDIMTSGGEASASAIREVADAIFEIGSIAGAPKGLSLLNEELSQLGPQMVVYGGRTADQNRILGEAEDRYKALDKSIVDVDMGLRGLTMTTDEQTEAIGKYADEQALVNGLIDDLRSIQGTAGMVIRSATVDQDALNDAFFNSLDPADKYTEKTLGLALAMGTLNEQQVAAILLQIDMETGIALIRDRWGEAGYTIQNATDDLILLGDEGSRALQDTWDKEDALVRRAEELEIVLERLAAGTYTIDIIMQQQDLFIPPGASPGERPHGDIAQHGLDKVIPPGYPNDSYPIWTSSGEHVQVTPKGQQSAGGGIVINVYTGSGNPEVIGNKVAGRVAEVLGVRG